MLFTKMHLLFLFGIFSVLLPGLSVGKIIHQAKNVSRHHNSGSDDKKPVVIHQYICQNTFKDDTIKQLDEKMKKIISLLQDKVGMPQNQAIFADPASSCKEIHEKNRSLGNEAYLIRVDYGSVPVYCHMTSSDIGACGGGGWTLVMKLDGEKQTFHYDSHYWTNKQHYNLEGGKTGFDTQETKLPTYWNTPFSKICLGMKIGHQINFMVINKQANSLYSLIADGKYRNISVGRDTWKKLIGSGAFLQTGCNKEGFNVYDSFAAKTRIGVVGSKNKYCGSSSYSRIGFGTGGYPDKTNTCGNEARDGGKHVKAMGYILVK